MEALKALEKVAEELPEIKATYSVLRAVPTPVFPPIPPVVVREEVVERKVKSISKFGTLLGEYDFFFEWEKDPTMEQIQTLITKIDEALSPLGCRYTITTK